MMTRSGSVACCLSRKCQSPSALDITDSLFPWFSRCMNTNPYQHESSIDIVCNTGSCGRSIPSQLEGRIRQKRVSHGSRHVFAYPRDRGDLHLWQFILREEVWCGSTEQRLLTRPTRTQAYAILLCIEELCTRSMFVVLSDIHGLKPLSLWEMRS